MLFVRLYSKLSQGFQRMTIHITPEIARAAYELLRTTLPFHRWKLYHADDIWFICRPMKSCLGSYVPGKVPKLYIDTNRHGSLDRLIVTLAHEMCHMRGPLTHGKDFKKLVASVCRYHNFDMKEMCD